MRSSQLALGPASLWSRAQASRSFAADSERRTFQSGSLIIINSTELRHVGFQMDAVDPLPTAPVAPAKATRRARAVAERPSTEGRRFRPIAEVKRALGLTPRARSRAWR